MRSILLSTVRLAGAARSNLAGSGTRRQRSLAALGLTLLAAAPALAQRDPGVRGGYQNTAGALQQRGIPIPHPPVISPHPTTGATDGGVHQLWVVRGAQNDNTIPNCVLLQPDFDAEFARGNLSFRIPSPMLGLGLIESIQDREIMAHFNATARHRAALGIAGHPNRSGNDGTINRFGWKAQNKSIAMFAGEAYNVEMGITNELFPTATEEDPSCQGPQKPQPNDVTRTDASDKDNKALGTRCTSWPTGCSSSSCCGSPMRPGPTPHRPRVRRSADRCSTRSAVRRATRRGCARRR